MDRVTAYDPLHGSDEQPPAPASLEVEVQLARELLAEIADANIHDDQAMLRAASGLNYRVRSLLAAVEAERGEGK